MNSAWTQREWIDNYELYDDDWWTRPRESSGDDIEDEEDIAFDDHDEL